MNKIDVCGVILPEKPLDNIELFDAVRKLKIRNFKSVYLRDTLGGRPNKSVGS